MTFDAIDRTHNSTNDRYYRYNIDNKRPVSPHDVVFCSGRSVKGGTAVQASLVYRMPRWIESRYYKIGRTMQSLDGKTTIFEAKGGRTALPVVSSFLGEIGSTILAIRRIHTCKSFSQGRPRSPKFVPSPHRASSTFHHPFGRWRIGRMNHRRRCMCRG